MADSDKTSLILVAHKLAVGNAQIKYDRQFKSQNKKIYVASELFDEHLTPDGLDLRDMEDLQERLQEQICIFLDKKFQHLIDEQKTENFKTLYEAKIDFPYLAEFMPSADRINGYKLEEKDKFIDRAINEKGAAEKNFWKNTDREMDPRLGKSVLYLYVKHRENILSLIEKALGDQEKDEDAFHQLLTDRGCTNLAKARHNLWLVDDKFSYFMEGYNAKRGEKVVDIEFYSYMDAEDVPQNVILIELKKPTKAHNAGQMVQQIIDYALDIFKKGKTRQGININMEKCKFYGYVIADIKDIEKELQTRHDKTFKNIAYTIGSYEGVLELNKQTDFYVTLLATQDLLKTAKDRNRVLFDLLRSPNP